MKPITVRQRKTLDFIKEFITKNGYSPTVREIGVGIFSEAHSTVCALLDHLEDKGYIERSIGKSRSIRIIEQNKVIIRPEVQWFAEQMELALRDNDYKGGWGGMSYRQLKSRLDEEVCEVELAYYAGHNTERLIRETADVANFAMMIADNSRIFGRLINYIEWHETMLSEDAEFKHLSAEWKDEIYLNYRNKFKEGDKT